MVILSPLGVLRIARSTWRSMTKRLLGIIGLLNLAPVGTFHFLLGLPGLRAASAADVAGAAAAGLDVGADAAEAALEMGATSEAISPQAANRATNFERTKTPTWHQRRPDQRFPRRGGTSPVLARTSATISATSRDADSRSSSVVTVSGSRPDAPPASAVSAARSPSTWKPRSAISAVAARSSSANRTRC